MRQQFTDTPPVREARIVSPRVSPSHASIRRASATCGSPATSRPADRHCALRTRRGFHNTSPAVPLRPHRDRDGSVLKVEMTVKTRGFTALKTEACGLTQAAYLHF